MWSTISFITCFITCFVLGVVLVYYFWQTKMLEEAILNMAKCNGKKTIFLVELNRLFLKYGDEEDSDYRELLECMNIKEEDGCIICNFKGD